MRSDALDRVRRILQDEAGQTLVEYALILTLVALVMVGALAGISGALERAFNAISSTLNGLIS
jgi:Flp pilus assembly pilin Flp